MNYSWSRNQTTMLYAHLGNDYVKALIMRNLSLTLTHFDFTTLGGPGFFGMPPIWSRRERQTTLTKLWGTFTAIFNTVECSRELFSGLPLARSSLAGFWATSWGGSVPVLSRPARLHLILVKQRVGTIPGLTQGNSIKSIYMQMLP